MATEPRYLYRFDNLESLRKQRFIDPVLRGRRSNGNEQEFPHYQVQDELATTREGDAVYRLSFWKTWDDVLVNLWAHQTGCAIQRIPENHPVLHEFKRGHDEYLKSHAWFYWNAMPENPSNPGWSPVGIPHTEIEVLHPNGSWIPMDQIPCLSDALPEGWKTYDLHGYGLEPKPIHVATRTSVEDGLPITWIMILQHAAPWIQATSLPLEIYSTISKDFAISLESTCWIYAVEHNDRTLAEEIYPRICQPREPGLKGFINRIRKKYPEIVVISPNTHFLPTSRVEILFEIFGISERLRRGDRWSNKHLLPPLERIQELRTKRESEFQAEQPEGKPIAIYIGNITLYYRDRFFAIKDSLHLSDEFLSKFYSYVEFHKSHLGQTDSTFRHFVLFVQEPNSQRGIAFLYFYLHPTSGSCNLFGLFVEQSYRQYGLGSRLLTEGLEIAVHLGATSVSVMFTENGASAGKLVFNFIQATNQYRQRITFQVIADAKYL